MRTPEAVAGMLCPVCKVGLTMSDRQGIEIDYCPQCRGIWLDRGELDKIIERSTAESAPPPPQQQRPAAQQQPWGTHDRFSEDRYHGGSHDPRYYKKRRKSWLEEIFD